MPNSKAGFALALSCLGLGVCALADPIADWNEAARDAVRAESIPPPRVSRGLAMLHVAIYDAFNGIQRTHRPYHVTDVAPSGASAEAAVSAAAYEVLLHLFADSETQKDNFTLLYTDLLAAIPDGQSKDDGVDYGRSVGDAIIQLRADDGAADTVSYTPGTEPGQWRPTPPAYAPALLPHWGQVTPFGVPSAAQLRPYLPPDLSSSNYAFELNLLREYGGAISSVRTDDQSEIAQFWANSAGTETPPGHWNRIALDVAATQGLSLAEKARLLALVNIALADASICCWDAKYAYNYWRPITAIREADTDSNPDTTPDPTWSPFVTTPPFPEYTSGHSTFSRAAASVMAGFFGTDAIPFTVGSDGLPGVTRSYPGFGTAADESGISRIYGGIHFPSANIAGQTTGHLLAQYVLANFLLPLKAPVFVLVSPGSAGAQITVLGEPGREYVLEASPDRATWVPVGTETAGANGEVEFSDPDAAGERTRFYRAIAH